MATKITTALTLGALALLNGSAFALNEPSSGKEWDTDRNGALSRSEFSSYQNSLFQKYDRDSDGSLDRAEQKDLLSMNVTGQANSEMHDAFGSQVGRDSGVTGRGEDTDTTIGSSTTGHTSPQGVLRDGGDAGNSETR